MTIKMSWEGRFLEDFEVGDVYRSAIGRTITETDNTWFTLLTNNDNQIHFNSEYAKHTPWGKTLVNSAFTIAVVTGLTVKDVSQNGFALGWERIVLPNPLFNGDTLYAETEVLDIRASKSDERRGIVKVRTRGIQQEGIVVIEFERSIMVWKREHAPNIGVFPEMKESN
jgi:itaconyl-CoA hydratase